MVKIIKRHCKRMDDGRLDTRSEQPQGKRLGVQNFKPTVCATPRLFSVMMYVLISNVDLMPQQYTNQQTRQQLQQQRASSGNAASSAIAARLWMTTSMSRASSC